MMRGFVLFIIPARHILYLLLMCLAAMSAPVNAADSGQVSVAAAAGQASDTVTITTTVDAIDYQ